MLHKHRCYFYRKTVKRVRLKILRVPCKTIHLCYFQIHSRFLRKSGFPRFPDFFLFLFDQRCYVTSTGSLHFKFRIMNYEFRIGSFSFFHFPLLILHVPFLILHSSFLILNLFIFINCFSQKLPLRLLPVRLYSNL